MCAELADLAMQLARAAAARTLAGWTEPEASPPAAQPQSDPETAPHANSAPTSRRAANPAASASSYKPIDPAVLFTRLAAVVRDSIALEARLTAGASTGAKSRAAALVLRADPRRAPLREAFGRATVNHPDRADLRRETSARVDEQLANDPDQTVGIGTLFFNLCDELGIEVDLAIVPDEFLTSYSETTTSGEAEINVPDPRATSPP
jgi:hypothetical protein